MQLNFDWKDGLLISASLLLTVGSLATLSQHFDVTISDVIMKFTVFVMIAGPVALRRVVFGAPVLPEPRTGALASIVSMLGLLATIFGMALVVLGALSINSSGGILVTGVLLLGFGSLASWWRYPAGGADPVKPN